MRKFLFIGIPLIAAASYAATFRIYQNAGTSGAFAYLQSKSCNANTTSVTCTFTTSPSAGNTIIVGCMAATTGDALSVTDTAGNTYTAVGSSILTTTNVRMNVFYAKNIIAGAPLAIDCTDNGSLATWVQAAVHEYNGLDTEAPFEVTSSSAPNPAVSTTTVVTGYATTSTAGDLMFAFAGRLPGTVLAQNGTLRENYSSNAFMTSQDTVVSAAGTVYQSSWTTTSGSGWGAIQAGFRLPHGKGTFIAQ